MNHVLIIAEAGVNHNGSLDLAYKMVDAAKRASVDCIKFQTFKSQNLVSKNASKADYQKENTGDGTQIEMLKKLELTYADFSNLKKYCDKVGMNFISTPFDLDSIEFLDSLDIPFWKIPSGEITNYPYLKAISKTRRPVILSTGMSTLDDIKQALNVLTQNGTTDIKILQCNTEYPTPFEDVNLNAMKTIRDAFGYEVGYSDHTKGIEIPMAAVAMGASVIEKHFTLDKNMEGPDHKASLEPDELFEMVKCIRNIEKSFGNGIKKPSESEKKNITIVRKSIVASCYIKKGETFTEKNITVKRPGSGISPMKWDDVIGLVAKKDYSEDDLIEL